MISRVMQVRDNASEMQQKLFDSTQSRKIILKHNRQADNDIQLLDT
jgi:hypothetical protein